MYLLYTIEHFQSRPFVSFFLSFCIFFLSKLGGYMKPYILLEHIPVTLCAEELSFCGSAVENTVSLVDAL